ncbi:methyltransferase [Desulfococcaceae bacterium HSG9]|nr:methyltransferase [Desulfococcaceae bacterium HSG9]
MSSKKWNAGKLLGLSGGFWEIATLHAAVRLDLFTVIGDESLDASEIANRLKADVRSQTMLLNALVAMRLLEKENERYRNTDASTALLCKNAPGYLGYMISHHYHLVKSWHQLDQAVLTGQQVRDSAGTADDDQRESFLMGMFNTAMGNAPKLTAQLKLTGKKRLLDLGGGPGTYAIHFCKNNPELKACVFDRPTTRPFAEKIIKQFDMSSRVSFQDGDFLKDNIQGRYDVVWLSHILHGEGPQNCRNIIDKTVAALEPGGVILIHDFILNSTMDGPLFPALFSLNMLLGTEDGQAYSEKQFTDMLQEAGVKQIERFPYQGPNDSGVLMGTI